MAKRKQGGEPPEVYAPPSGSGMRVDTKFNPLHVAEMSTELLCSCPGCDDEPCGMMPDSDFAGVIGEDEVEQQEK